ncbi:MAG: hypothetical protein KIT73_05250 [Burkholderiales bacterium]|nr:hypothetical protein [Burkholderiales bacterium]
MLPWGVLLKSVPWSDLARAAPGMVRKFRGNEEAPPPPRPADAGEGVTFAEHEHLRREFENFRITSDARAAALEVALLQARRRGRWLAGFTFVGFATAVAALALVLLR